MVQRLAHGPLKAVIRVRVPLALPRSLKIRRHTAIIETITKNDILKLFQERANAELKLALDVVKWWNERVASGLVKAEHAKGYIDAAKNIIRTKRHVLGIPELPC
jgi:hypothetical protein